MRNLGVPISCKSYSETTSRIGNLINQTLDTTRVVHSYDQLEESREI
jgi:hypothetical protein